MEIKPYLVLSGIENEAMRNRQNVVFPVTENSLIMLRLHFFSHSLEWQLRWGWRRKKRRRICESEREKERERGADATKDTADGKEAMREIKQAKEREGEAKIQGKKRKPRETRRERERGLTYPKISPSRAASIHSLSLSILTFVQDQWWWFGDFLHCN